MRTRSTHTAKKGFYRLVEFTKEERDMKQRSILVADDIDDRTESGKKRSQAIQYTASSLAQRLRAGIELLFVEDIRRYSRGPFDASGIQAWHSRHQKELTDIGVRYGAPVHASLKSGPAAEQILIALHAKAAPELVVMGTAGRKRMERLLIGSVAEEVVRHSQRPVLVISPVAREKVRDFGAREEIDILVATDLGKNSRAAERYALSLAKRINARVFLYHCLGDRYRAIIRDSSMVAGWVPGNLDKILSQLREDSIKSLDQKTRFFQERGVPCDYKIDENDVLASCAVDQECRRGYTLAIMGTHGRNILLEAFLGSTARDTIMNSPIPVITVHSG
jgi:nucleotide-binding universal stress UspA family protein